MELRDQIAAMRKTDYLLRNLH